MDKEEHWAILLKPGAFLKQEIVGGILLAASRRLLPYRQRKAWLLRRRLSDRDASPP
jgi:hypothetical protein